MKKYYDLLTFSKECKSFGEQLGYDQVLFDEVNYQEPRKASEIKPVKGKVNIVKGGSLEVNRAAVRDKRVQVLLDPVSADKKFFDTAVARIAKDNNITIGVSLASLLDTNGLMKVKLLRNITSMITICNKLSTRVVIVSGARNKWGMRAPQDLASIGSFIGLDEAQSLWTVSQAPEAIIEEVIA